MRPAHVLSMLWLLAGDAFRDSDSGTMFGAQTFEKLLLKVYRTWVLGNTNAAVRVCDMRWTLGELALIDIEVGRNSVSHASWGGSCIIPQPMLAAVSCSCARHAQSCSLNSTLPALQTRRMLKGEVLARGGGAGRTAVHDELSDRHQALVANWRAQKVRGSAVTNVWPAAPVCMAARAAAAAAAGQTAAAAAGLEVAERCALSATLLSLPLPPPPCPACAPPPPTHPGLQQVHEQPLKFTILPDDQVPIADAGFMSDGDEDFE